MESVCFVDSRKKAFRCVTKVIILLMTISYIIIFFYVPEGVICHCPKWHAIMNLILYFQSENVIFNALRHLFYNVAAASYGFAIIFRVNC